MKLFEIIKEVFQGTERPVTPLCTFRDKMNRFDAAFQSIKPLINRALYRHDLLLAEIRLNEAEQTEFPNGIESGKDKADNLNRYLKSEVIKSALDEYDSKRSQCSTPTDLEPYTLSEMSELAEGMLELTKTFQDLTTATLSLLSKNDSSQSEAISAYDAVFDLFTLSIEAFHHAGWCASINALSGELQATQKGIKEQLSDDTGGLEKLQRDRTHFQAMKEIADSAKQLADKLLERTRSAHENVHEMSRR